MKVIHTVNTLRRGGAERQLATIISYCDSIKHSVVTLYVSKGAYLDMASSDSEILHVSSGSYLQRIRDFKKIFEEINPSLVYSWGVSTFLISYFASKGKGIKLINGSIRHGTFKKTPGGFLRMIVLHFSRYVVANSIAGLRANKLSRGFVLYNGVEDRFNRSTMAKYESRSVIICSLANLVPYKDYPTVFRALAIIKKNGIDFEYRVMGDGPLMPEYKNMVSDLDIVSEVRFLGNIPDPENHLAESDIFVHSSKGEGCPNAILEAMYMSLPIITTGTGGTTEVLDDNAVIFEYGDIYGLSSALMRLIQDPVERNRMGVRSGQIARERFSVQRMIYDYERIVNSIHSGNTTIVSDLYYRKKKHDL